MLFEKAIKLDSTFASAHLNLALAYRNLWNSIGSEESFKKAKDFSHKAMNKERLYIEAYYARHINRNYDKAFIIFEEMSKTYPKEKLAHAELGWMFWRKEIYNKAIKELEIALELDPEYGLAYNYLVDTYIEKGDFNSALKICSLYASKCPWDALPFDRLGDFYLAEGKLDKAMTNYKEAVKIKPEFSSNYKIAYVYAFQENYVEALKWIDYYFNRARSFGKRGEGL